MSTPRESRTIDVSRIVGPTLKGSIGQCLCIVPFVGGLFLIPRFSSSGNFLGILGLGFLIGVRQLISYWKTGGTQISVDEEGVSWSRHGITQSSAAWSQVHAIRYSQALYHGAEAATMNLLDSNGSTVLEVLVPMELLEFSFAKPFSELMKPDLVRQQESDRAAFQVIRDHVHGRESFDEDFFPGRSAWAAVSTAIGLATVGFALLATKSSVGYLINLIGDPVYWKKPLDQWIEVLAFLLIGMGVWTFSLCDIKELRIFRPRWNPHGLSNQPVGDWKKLPPSGAYRVIRPPILVGCWSLQEKTFLQFRFGLGFVSILLFSSAVIEFAKGVTPIGYICLVFLALFVWLAWIAGLSAQRRARLLDGYWESFVVGEDGSWTVRMTDGTSAHFSSSEVWMTDEDEGTVTLGEGRKSILTNVQLLERVEPN